ncbi:serpentine receptor, putative [Plasmodium yoelii]|uniref:Serpentine receptor 1 n=2 Tax=Plasmodium yoelii TaxID=5861 RepID=A0AAF0B5G8_PLAYO|nr:serpentine receptor, putative [Plasmodium yoelii]WBY57285.1 serpentine receptor 1 [Plasmodium yoelii yoelii]VTZ78378.1 serpentine receptor, putative [Plasmodium yoelii]|eukprot:XP_022812178.1 serpentine receptor, putative [Plasmodium yoelii]
MIKFIIGIIFYYLLYCFYGLYEHIRTPIYYNSETKNKYISNKNGDTSSQGYIHEPFKNEIQKNDRLDYHFYLSLIEHIDLNKYINGKYINKDKNFINIYNFRNVKYNWDDVQVEKNDINIVKQKIKKNKTPNNNNYFSNIWPFSLNKKYPYVDIVLPKTLINKNQNIYLHIITYLNGKLYRHGCVTKLIATFKEFQYNYTTKIKKKKKKKWYLWKWLVGDDKKEEEIEIEDKKKYNKLLLHIPKKIKFGPIIEYNDININKLSIFSNIVLDISMHKYFLPTHFNDDIEFSNEYIIVNNSKTSQEKNNNLLLNSIRVEYEPISYSHYNLLNIIMFNIKYLKKKYNMISYDIDSLSIYLFENISIYIYIICIIIIIIIVIINIIVLFLYDIKSWNVLISLYLFFPDTILLKIISSVFILLYLNNNNENNNSKIIMIFYLIDIGICLWNFIRKYEIQIGQDYPYVIINESNINENNINESNTIKKKDSVFKSIEIIIKNKIQNITILIIPLLFVYNILYKKYDSFYLFFILTIGECSYIFNFMLMCQNIIANYLTKTVPNFPLIYIFPLFLNVITDDIFALLFRIPTIHKFNAFADDFVFFVFCVQLCLYKKVAKKNAVMEKESKKDK